MTDGLTFDLGVNSREFEQAMNRAAGLTQSNSATITRSLDLVAARGGRSFANLDASIKRSTEMLGALKAKADALKSGALTQFASGKTTSVGDIASQIGANGFKGYAALAGGPLGIVSLAAGVVAAQATTYAALQKTATEAGVTAAQVAGLQSALGKLGISSTDTASLLTGLYDRLLSAKAGSAEVASAFQAAGISFQNADGTLRPTIDVLQDVQRYLIGTASEADKAKLATAAFGEQLGGQFVTAAEKAGTALNDMTRASHEVGSAIVDDLARAATQGVGYLDVLVKKLDTYYSRFKEVAGLSLSASDQKNVVGAHLQEAIGARAGLDTAANLRDVSPSEYAAANKRLFEAAAAFDKANPIRVIPGGDPRVKPKSAPAPAPAASADDDDVPSRGHGGRARKAGGGGSDRVETVITDLERQVASERGLAAAVGLTSDQKQRSLDLEKARQAATERGSPLTAQEEARVLALADAYSKAHKQLSDFERQQSAVADAAKAFGDNFESAVEGVIVSGNSLRSTIASLLKTLESGALKAILTGSGPLAGILGLAPAADAKGASSVGGLFGGALSLGKIFGLADGGQVVGPGSSRSDSVPALLSHGEFVVNAAAAGKHGALLRAINSGGFVARLANGGSVGTLPAIPSAVLAGGGNASVSHSTVVNMMPAQGVTAQQVARAIADNQRAADRRILSTYKVAKMRG